MLTEHGAAQKHYTDAVIITRNNAWLVKRSNEIAKALEGYGIKIDLIAYSSSTDHFIEAKGTPQLSPARNWIDGYFERTFIPWVEERLNSAVNIEEYPNYLDSGRYLTLNQLAHKSGLHGAICIPKMGDAGRKQFHELVMGLKKDGVDLKKTLGISVDTRLLIGDDTRSELPFYGFHAGRMRVNGGNKKALGEHTTIKMFKGNETELQGACHLLGSSSLGVDSGTVIGQVTVKIDPVNQSMFSIRDAVYGGLTDGFINDVLKTVVFEPIKIVPMQQGDGEVYKELTEGDLQSLLIGNRAQDKKPHEKLIRTTEFLDQLALFLPPGVSITEMPNPLSIGITQSELKKFSESRAPTHPRVRSDHSRYDRDGWITGLS